MSLSTLFGQPIGAPIEMADVQVTTILDLISKANMTPSKVNLSLYL